MIADAELVDRDESGKWKKGSGGNPNGRTVTRNLSFAQLSLMCQGHIPRAVEVICEIMNSYEAKSMERLKAAQIVLSYGVGLPTQVLHISQLDNSVPTSMLTQEQLMQRLNLVDRRAATEETIEDLKRRIAKKEAKKAKKEAIEGVLVESKDEQ